MVSTSPLISKSFSSFTNRLGSVPSAPTTTGITVTFMFISFFLVPKQGLGTYLFSISFIFTLWYAGTAKPNILHNLCFFFFFVFFFFFFFCWLSIVLVVCPRFGDPFLSQNPGKFVSHSLFDRFWVVHVPLVSMGKLIFFVQIPVESWWYILTACISVSSSFSSFG